MGLRKNPSIMESLMVKPAPLTLPRPPGNNGTLILTFTPYSKPSSKITNPRSLCARNSYRTTCPPKTTSQGYNGWKWLMVSWLEVPKSEILLSHVEQCRWNWLLTPKNNQIMEKYDLPPKRFKPIPVQVIHRIAYIAQHSQCPINQSTPSMIILALFSLIRPVECTYSTLDTVCFTLSYVQLFIRVWRLKLSTAVDQELLSAFFWYITFGKQKINFAENSLA